MQLFETYTKLKYLILFLFCNIINLNYFLTKIKFYINYKNIFINFICIFT